MKKVIAIILLTVLISSLYPLSAFGETENSLTNYLDRKIADMVEDKMVKGAVVTVFKEGELELSKGYGFADEKKSIMADNENTAFRVGSISKTFVAIAALQLAEQGKLDMHTPISKYLESDFPKFEYGITMHNLLTHTAGFEALYSGTAIADKKNADLLSISVRKYKPNQFVAPGTVISYSDYGIALAAYVVQSISGQRFDQYAEDNIFKPLSMDNTTFKYDDENILISKGYGKNGEEKKEPVINIYPAGSVVSTAQDMGKYLQWLIEENDLILPYKIKQLLFDQQFAMSYEFDGIGYTWNRNYFNDSFYYEKGGETVNFLSYIAVYPEQKTGVFLSFNTQIPQKKMSEIKNKISEIVLGLEENISVLKTKQTFDISGNYIANRSSFTTMEKAMNFLTPDQTFSITGNIKSGFKLNGEMLTLIGKDYYKTPYGNLKFLEKNEMEYLVNNTAISYMRAKWYENTLLQMLILSVFIFVSCITSIIGVFCLKKRKKYNLSLLSASLPIITICMFTAICCFFYMGIYNYSLLNFEIYIKTCAVIITALAGVSIINSIYLYKNKLLTKINKLFIIWNITLVVLCIWMIQVNIL